jgi:hypothetical protein
MKIRRLPIAAQNLARAEIHPSFPLRLDVPVLSNLKYMHPLQSLQLAIRYSNGETARWQVVGAATSRFSLLAEHTKTQLRDKTPLHNNGIRISSPNKRAMQ